MIHSENTSSLDIYIWDVGHGLSVTLVTPFISFASGYPIGRRRVVQVDAGINGQYSFSPIKHLVDNRGLHTIDCLVVSHVDQDHIDDLANVDELQAQGKLNIITLLRNRTYPAHLISEDSSQESAAKTTYRQLDASYTSLVYNPNTLIPENFGGLIVDSCYLDYREGLESNNASVVLSVSYGSTQIVIPGDIEGDAVFELKSLNRLPVPNQGHRILLAPHHGRESAEPAALLEHYKPSIVLASAKEEDEFTDGLYSSSSNITGHMITHSNGTMSRHKFNATKGEAFHINIDPGFGYLPLVKRVPYEKKQPFDYLLRDNLIKQLLKTRTTDY